MNSLYCPECGKAIEGSTLMACGDCQEKRKAHVKELKNLNTESDKFVNGHGKVEPKRAAPQHYGRVIKKPLSNQ